MQDTAYILIVRDDSEERIQVGNRTISATEQLNFVALALANEYPIVFEVHDLAGQTIRFTGTLVQLQRIATRAAEVGMDVVLGPVEMPEERSQRIAPVEQPDPGFMRMIRHMPVWKIEQRIARGNWNEAEKREARSEISMQMMRLKVEVKEWDLDQIMSRVSWNRSTLEEQNILTAELAVRKAAGSLTA